jgi:hypothetical protein
MTKDELLRELYQIQHRDLDPDGRMLEYQRFLMGQGLPQRQVIDLLLLATTYFLTDLPDDCAVPLSKQIENLLSGINRRKR